MTLFDDFVRNDTLPARETESTFAFLNRHDSVFFQRVRDLLEDWFAHLPADQRESWKKAFQSGDDRVSESAFWELYLHEAFLRMGCQVEVHPAIIRTEKRPDFLVKCDGSDFYVEATLLGASDEELAKERRRDRLYETLQGISSPDFFVMIEDGFQEGPESPPGRQFRSALQQWVPQYEWEPLRAVFEREGPEAMPSTSFEGAGWQVPIRLLPKPPHLRGAPAVRPIAVYGAIASVRDPIEDLRRPLREKATRYGVLPHPYVVAVIDPSSWGLDHQDVHGAVYGRTVDEIRIDASGNPVHVRSFRKGDGFWQGSPNPQNTRVSAVLVAPNIRPESVVELEPELWLNPWASQPLTVDLSWQSHRLNPDTGQVDRHRATRDPADLFGLPREWPGSGRPFG